MGLDQYAYRCNSSLLLGKQVDFDIPEDCCEFFYWRKHPNLHGWMQNLYRSKGGTDTQFNCAAIRLEIEDLDKLELAVRHDDLPHTVGFFFGSSDSSDKKVERDLEFIKEARRILEEGDAIYYTSWW